MNALITLLVPPFQNLTYGLPDFFPETFWKEGMRVAVPLGRGPLRPGIICKLGTEAPAGVRLKNVTWPLETEPLLTAADTELMLAVSERYCLAPGTAAGMMLPFLKDLNVTLRRLDIQKKKQGAGEAPPKAEEKALLHLKDISGMSAAQKQKIAGELVNGRAQILPPRQDAARSERCILSCSAPWPVRPNALKQIKCLEYLMLHGATNHRALVRELGPGSASVVQSLLRAGLVRLESDQDDIRNEELQELLAEPASPFSFTLTEDQQKAVDALIPLLDRTKTAQRLLFGVTGSGKTAVYIRIMQAALEQGTSVLLLAPEVALAHKLRKDCRLALPSADIVFYHGYQSQVRREATFRETARKKTPCIVIGTRSALFLPIHNLSCIIMDEEHDAAFKQETRVPYHAKEVAWFKARQEKALLLLGSATPDIKTWYAASQGLLPVLRLPKRIGKNSLPPVELVTIDKRRFMDDKDTLLAPSSLKALDETLERGEQAIILLNRRGFAPLIYCPDCRSTLSCPNCSVGLSFHRELGRLLCHYCGYSLDFPAPCPSCGHMHFLPMGEGTERLSDYLTARYGREVLRFDRDSTRREGAMEEMLARFASHEADILVGTQMVSKGHHFPDVTLAVVADGDLGLGLPDYRAAERTFQLLVQSSGRAGRGEKPGKVLIQTRNTSHYCWKYIMNADYEGFYAEELARRQRFRFPPFSHVTLIRFSFERGDDDASAAMQDMETWLRTTAKERSLPLLGPIPSPLPVLNNVMRYQCLLKTDEWGGARRLYYDALSQPCASKLKLFLDLDPFAML
ncbi:MAG: primosomal protein N' [Desulfovibrionaceae bacterium]|nr:primosomal protein N' [Desulfovibrionaceae bacterium]